MLVPALGAAIAQAGPAPDFRVLHHLIQPGRCVSARAQGLQLRFILRAGKSFPRGIVCRLVAFRIGWSSSSGWSNARCHARSRSSRRDVPPKLCRSRHHGEAEAQSGQPGVRHRVEGGSREREHGRSHLGQPDRTAGPVKQLLPELDSSRRTRAPLW
jgi:hypothetical protein